MSRYRVTLTIEIDDEVFAEHDGEHETPPNDINDWYDSDLFEAHRLGIVEVEHAELEQITRIEDNED